MKSGPEAIVDAVRASNSLVGDGAIVPVDGAQAQAKKCNRPGSSYSMCNNSKVKAYKSLHPKEKLSTEEKLEAGAAARREWQLVKDGVVEGMDAWSGLARANKIKKVAQADEAKSESEAPFTGLLGASSHRSVPISPQNLVDRGVAGSLPTDRTPLGAQTFSCPLTMRRRNRSCEH